ncbi:MAG: hypothetical protein JWL76_360 [Thermoleophilia bacterium]|nr:hypothetical protein [Thermoleophilia bacterium]
MPYAPSKAIHAGAAVLLGATMLLLLAAPAAHAAGGTEIGANLGNLLATWARSLFSGVVALVSVVFLVNRRYNDLALFVAASVLVGGLIFSASTVANVIRAIWTTLGA